MNASEPRDDAPGDSDDAPITPLAWEPTVAVRAQRRRLHARQLVIAALVTAATLLVFFLFTARALQFAVTPADARIDIDGGPRLRIGGTVLLRPGQYLLNAQAPGYEALRETITVGADASQTLTLQLKPLPGLLLLKTVPASVQVSVDGRPAIATGSDPLRLPAGTHALALSAARYLPRTESVEIQGRGVTQTLELSLKPAWGEYALDSVPTGATVRVDGTVAGQTPLTLQLLAGQRQLLLEHEGYANAPVTVIASVGETRTLDTVTLARADRRLQVSSTPSGASVTLDGQFQGTTPLTVAVDSTRAHELIAFTAGHERAVRRIPAGTAGEETIALRLPPLTGEVRVQVTPPGAEVRVDGRTVGRGNQSLTLPAATQTIVVSHPGYAERSVSVTPRPGFPQTLRVTLRTQEQERNAGITPRARTPAGQELVLLTPGDYTMGSSRREPERGANEAMRQVRMQRAFYLGVAEVTNAEFRRFRADHSSGNFKGKSLNGEQQPAVAVTWNDAARYCNWLSEQEHLPPFYEIEKGVVLGINAAGMTGYRLPTEAEWEWASRVQADGSLLRFPWGNDMPPPAKAGNFADASGAALLGAVIGAYDDGFPVAAPVRSFAPNRLGLFDIAGNAAEWVHDYYEAASAQAPGLVDPLGAELGEYHVIRGASWRHGEVKELRLAFRDFGIDGRPDVGFRVARYAR